MSLKSLNHLLYLHVVILLCISLLHVQSVHMAFLADTSSSVGTEIDHEALLAIKSKIIHDPQRVMSSWNDSLPFCQWQGITCGRRHRRVTLLNLTSKGLEGSLSPYIGNLSFLREVLLYNNTLQNIIPVEISRLHRLQFLRLDNNSFEGEIPANISRCSKLIYFRLRYNRLVGNIPTELSSLHQLKTLYLDHNHLTGTIPPSLGNITSLNELSLGHNDLRGSIPDSLGLLKRLKVLLLGENNLHGTVPPSIYDLSYLNILEFSNNQLYGALPADLGLSLPRLIHLAVFMNQFTGSIPISLSNASELETIQLHENNFKGKIPTIFGHLQHLSMVTLSENNLGTGEATDMDFFPGLANCSNLKVLVISSNKLRGPFPHSVGNLSNKLTFFNIGDNHISGGIPPSIANLLNLEVLDLYENRLTGTIPTEIGMLQNLQSMNLGYNMLSGYIPSSLGNLSLLNKLYISNNKLEGPIPSTFGNCQRLLALDLSQNFLSGTIPRQMFLVSSLAIGLILSQNHLSGPLPFDIGNLVNLNELDISNNRLFSEIPTSLGQCTSLESIYLDSNLFTGPIPSSLSSLRGIQNFDISNNNLSGPIPSYLEDFSLKYLNISFNNLEGEVPIKGVFRNASEVSVVGNHKLCGGIPELQLPKCNIRKTKKQKELYVQKYIISIIVVLAGITLLSSLIFCFLKKKRKDQFPRSLLKESFQKVSYEMLLKATAGFSSSNLIGVGSFGSVFKGTLNQDETIVAIKVLNLQRQGASKSFMAECEALKNIRHRNILKIVTACSTIDFQGNDFKALVYEYMPNGSLETWLYPIQDTYDGQQLQGLSLVRRLDIALEVACALDYLHHRCQHPIIHCDLKPSNILLDKDMIAHVGDLGLTRFLQESTQPTQSSSLGIRGTVGYTAPEYGLGSPISRSGDVYSYGILLLEMITGKRPTNIMFEEGLNLHNFVKTSLPYRVMEIIDPMILTEANEVIAMTNREQRQAGNDNRTEEYLASILKIGLACSLDSPRDRMDINDVVNELQKIRDGLLRTQVHLN